MPIVYQAYEARFQTCLYLFVVDVVAVKSDGEVLRIFLGFEIHDLWNFLERKFCLHSEIPLCEHPFNTDTRYYGQFSWSCSILFP